MSWISCLIIISHLFGLQTTSSPAQQPLLALGQEQPNIDIKDPAYWYNKGKLLLEGGTGIGGAKGRIELANGKLAEIFTFESLLLLTDGGISLDEFNINPQAEIVKQNLEEIEGYYLRAQAMLKESINDFNRAIELDQQYTDAYLKKADAYILMNMKYEAEQDYKNAFSAGVDSSKKITLSASELMDITDRINYTSGDVSVTFLLAPEDKESLFSFVMNKVQIYLIPTDNNLFGKALARYYVVSIPMKGEITIKLADEILIDEGQYTSSCALPTGKYTCFIKIPDLHIQAENQIPFQIRRYWPKNYENIFPASDNQSEMTLEPLGSIAAETQEVIKISCSKDNFTTDNRVKEIKSPENMEKFPIGHYRVTIEIPLQLSKGQEYNFNIVPLSSFYILLKKLWWAPLLGAAITSIISYLR